MFPTLTTTWYSLLALLVLGMTATPATASSPAPSPDYQLAISFDLARNTLTGTARITISAGDTLTLHTGSLTITGILLKRQDGSSHEAHVPQEPTFSVPTDPGEQELFISYSCTADANGPNLIGPDAVTLVSDWYPLPERRMHYQLSAALPEGFTAVAESDLFPLARSGNSVTATFPHPTDAIHFAAARYAVTSLEVRKGLKVYTLLFQEDADLAAGYLEKARDYIRRYEREIGPFPYRHYVIVANRLPTGLGMPTFTLLGQTVLRLPFIKDTSLGHEILHSWFGNSVDVDPEQGNWCEGLTAYLSDHAYRQDAGEGAAYRKESILNYLSYVHDDNVIPLSEFVSGSHSQPLARARRAVGYSRALMLFHELHERVGQEHFRKGIRSFYAQFKHRTASWNDIRDTFNAIYQEEDLTPFFAERLSRTDIPAFHAEHIAVYPKDDKSLLTFQLVQDTTLPYSLKIPIRVATSQGDYYFRATTASAEKAVTLPLPGRPLEIALDPGYSLLRELEFAETPAIWSRFMGAENTLAILASEEAEKTYRPLLEQLRKESWTVKYDHEITNAELRDADLLILGPGQQAGRNLFGSPALPQPGFSLDVRPNPLNPAHVAVLTSSNDERETAAAVPRLGHYGKYTFLHFRKGRAVERGLPESAAGIHYQLEQLPLGGSTKPLQDFDAIAKELSTRDVIYIGETHTSVSDHRLQLRLLEALASRIPDLAIGMEMFPATSQEALDTYILGDTAMTEKEFLKASRYFEVWNYDFRYFQEIMQLARQKRLPVIGLNLEREIVATVYRTGSTDELPIATRNSLPQERDLGMQGYAERLREIQAMHDRGSHGNGLVSGFIQAQALWDETMAENIVRNLQGHPGRKMVVLAGSQHTRKDSGIPPRVARRMQAEQASVLNILNGSTPANLAEIADYFFLSEPMELEEAPKMGIVLQERQDDGREYVEIIDFSPNSKARAAGLQTGDILRTVGGYAITTMADIRIAMVDARSGDTIIVQAERGTAGKRKELEFAVELIRIEAEKPHP